MTASLPEHAELDKATSQANENSEQTSPAAATAPRITITEDGPYVVSGSVPLLLEAITPNGGHLEYRILRTFPLQQTYALCRCGHTTTPPFCDGSHMSIRFDGVETASREPFFERAEVFRGEGIYLLDDNRCAYARFCHREDGDAWSLTERSGDEHLRHEAVKASSDCPSGRLVHYDAQSGAEQEPSHRPAISILEDPQQGVSGPLFVRGRISLIAADGGRYEERNRYTLCRCGATQNKPFCDALHVNIGFDDTIRLE